MANALLGPDGNQLLIIISSIISSIALIGASALLLFSPPLPPGLSDVERTFVDQYTGKKKKFPHLLPKATCDLSIIIPCFNEVSRLKIMLDETVEYLESQDDDFNYEIIIVDDGSSDGTSKLALKLAREIRPIKVLTLQKNRGKGGAVMQGFMASSGKLVLMADADGATKFSDLDKLKSELNKIEKDGKGIAIGSRAHMVSSDSVVKRSFIRNLLMRCFHFAVYALGIQSIKDTQCGFKLFTRSAILLIAPSMHVQGWIFDIEMLVLALKHGIPIAEVPVTWHEVDGSKMSLVTASVEMLIQLLMIRVNYMIGRWK